MFVRRCVLLSVFRLILVVNVNKAYLGYCNDIRSMKFLFNSQLTCILVTDMLLYIRLVNLSDIFEIG